MKPDPHAPKRHPGSPIFVSPSGWRARCTCGWESGRFSDRNDASDAFLHHAETEHGYVILDND